MNKFLLTISIAVAFSEALASDWQVVSANDSADVYVDKNSISTQKGYRKAWLLWNYSSERKTTAYPYKPFKSSKTLTYFNCDERTSGTSYTVLYSDTLGNGDTVDSFKVPVTHELFSEIIPDSIGELNLQFVCTHKLANKKQNASDYMDEPKKTQPKIK